MLLVGLQLVNVLCPVIIKSAADFLGDLAFSRLDVVKIGWLNKS